ncbi:hypothetical protein ABT284_07165, partial [Nocardioides sp. NPDC000441]
RSSRPRCGRGVGRRAARTSLCRLVSGGVARSRSDALGWCVKLVQQHSSEWLEELQQSLVNVERVRANGPDKG